jgi:predicted RNase H-like HicB family nuclease
MRMMTLIVELEREDDGRWIAEIPELPGVMVYGSTEDEAMAKVQPLALRVMADRLENGEAESSLLNIAFRAA